MTFNKKSMFVALIALSIMISAVACYRTVSHVLEIPPGERGVIIEENVMVAMRDDVKLATDIYRPSEPGKYPAILTRIPYGTDNRPTRAVGKYFARNKYVVIVQDTRGIENSEGIFWPFIYEVEDGFDTTQWISKQPWYNGKLGTLGGSYFGITQWAAARENPLVTCMVPLFTSPTTHKVIFNGGAIEYLMSEGWVAQMEAQITGGEWSPDFATGYYNEPMRDARKFNVSEMKKTPEKYSPVALLAHPGDIYLEPETNFLPYYKTVSAPSLNVAGWFDQFLQPQLEDFIHIRKEGKGEAKKSRLIVGPWVHGAPFAEMQGKKIPAIRFFLREHLDWYDYWLKGIDNGIVDEAPVKIFVMGENVWRDEQEWPLARTEYTNYYIHSNGDAHLYPNSGTITLEPPSDAQPADEFDYDPRNPSPPTGGTFQPFTGHEAGSFDQGEFLTRSDSLLYMTPPLEKGVEVTGQITATLYASSSAKDTDFTAMLVDVHPDGKVMYIQDGCVRARYREGYDTAIPLIPGKVYRLGIDLWSTSNYFLPGHRIGLLISSSNYPAYDRNTNGGGEGGISNIVTAHQKIFHTPEYPTHITLPVIPR